MRQLTERYGNTRLGRQEVDAELTDTEGALWNRAQLGRLRVDTLPELRRVIAGIDHWLCPMYSDRPELDYDPDSISALTEKRQATGYGPVSGEDDDCGNNYEELVSHSDEN